MASACNWLGVTTVAVLSEEAKASTLLSRIEFGIYGFFCVVVRTMQLFVVVTLLFVETKCNSTSEIERRLGNSF
jgi:hypothetical protein